MHDPDQLTRRHRLRLQLAGRRRRCHGSIITPSPTTTTQPTPLRHPCCAVLALLGVCDVTTILPGVTTNVIITAVVVATVVEMSHSLTYISSQTDTKVGPVLLARTPRRALIFLAFANACARAYL